MKLAQFMNLATTTAERTRFGTKTGIAEPKPQLLQAQSHSTDLHLICLRDDPTFG
jgi:hypothetical protein